MSHIESFRGGGEAPNVVDFPLRAEGPREPDNIDFVWLLSTFQRRFWTFMITVIATIAAVLLFMFMFPPLYTATARVTINQRNLTATPDKEAPVVAPLQTLSNNVDTETQVIQSRRVARIVVHWLSLDADPEFASTHVGLKQALANFFTMFHPQRQISREDRVIDAVLANLDPERFLQTNAIDINFKDNNPVKAQRIANAFAQAYLSDQVASKIQQNRAASGAMQSQLEAMRAQAASDADKVQSYKIAHNLLSVGSQTLTEQEISGYDQAVATAKAEAAADQANLRTAQQQLARGSNGEDVGEALSSSVVTELRGQRAQLADKLANLEGHYGPRYPDLAQARRELANIDLEIQAEILRTVSNLSAKAKISQQRLASLEGTRNAAKGELSADNAAEAGLEDLSRAATVSQTIYEAYLQRFKESTAQEHSLAPDADIVSVAGLPSAASFPDPVLFPALGMVASILFGCAAVLLAELLETRIITAEDVERKLNRPYLGGIPRLNAGSPLQMIVAQPLGAYADAFRGLLASVRLTGLKSGVGVVVATAAAVGEGKTTIAAGLARTSALQGIPTVLIDCDSRGRGSTMAKDLRIADPGPGLVRILKGEAGLDDALRRDVESGAAYLSLGEGRDIADDLLGGEAMDALLAELRRRFEAIIIDAPTLSIALARTLAAKADAVVIVATWRCKPEDGLEVALRLPPFDRSTHVGVALNRVVLPRHRGRRFASLLNFNGKLGPQHG